MGDSFLLSLTSRLGEERARTTGDLDVDRDSDLDHERAGDCDSDRLHDLDGERE